MMPSIGNYHIEATIGVGGSGTVYRTTHPVLKRPVAIKVLHDTLMHDPDVRAQFLREARLTLDLSHPAIIKLYDIGQSGDQLYLVMALLENGSLADATGGRAFPLPNALALSAALADALAYAHRLGVVHRDVKPSNVLVRADGSPVLTDFGIATDRFGVGAPRAAGAATYGTLAYCAPEQLDGRSVDARADMYAFGVLVYELLTGKLPFEGPADDIVYHHLRSRPQPICTIVADIPPALDALVQRLLAKEPAQRPPDMDAVAAELRAIAHDTSAAARSGRSATPVVIDQHGAALLPALGVTTRLPARHAAVTPSPYSPPPDPASTPAPSAGPLVCATPPTPVAMPSAHTFRARIQRNSAWLMLIFPALMALCMWAPWSRVAPTPLPEIATGDEQPPAAAPEVREFAVLPIMQLDEPPMVGPQEVESGSDRWSIASVGVYQDGPLIRVYGVVRNAGERERANPKVRVLIRDREGNQVASNEAPAQHAVLAPGSSSGFSITLDDGDGTLPPADQISTAFEVRSDPLDAVVRRPHAARQLGVELARAPDGTYLMVGQLTLDARSTAAIEAQVIVFDGAGTVIGLATLIPDVPLGMGAEVPAESDLTTGYVTPSRVVELMALDVKLEEEPASMWAAVGIAAP